MSIWTRRFQRLSLGDPEYTPEGRRWVTDGNENTSAETRRLGTKVMMSRIDVEETKFSMSNRSQLDQRGTRTVVARPPPPALRRESRRTGRPRNGRGRRRGRTRTHEGRAQNALCVCSSHCFEKRLHTAVHRHSHDSRVTLHCVACGRVIERVPVCAVCSCASSVLACDAHFFLADGAVALSLAAASTTQATPSPKGVTAVPHPLQPSGLRTRGIASHCSHPVCHLVSRPHCRKCVKHSRAGRMRAQNAVPPHSHVVTSPRRHSSRSSTNISRRRLPGPRSGFVGHHSWSPTNNHHNRISTRSQSGRRWLCVAQLLSTSHQSGIALIVFKCRYCQT